MQWWCAAQGTAWSWSWKAYPGVWLFVGVLALVLSSIHRRYGDETTDGFSPLARRGFSVAGVLLLWIALDWPVGALGAGYLASVHMVQFLLIAVAAPPLLLLGTPRAALHALMRVGPIALIVRVLSQPIAALIVFTGLMGLTHWPALADTLMARQWGSFALDMLWLFSGVVFWWPVAVNLPERDWIQEPFKMGYLIAATLVNTGVFAFLTFSEVPVYATFELAPPVGTLSTRDDQLVAGLLMKVGGALVLWTSITILWFRWYRRSQQDEASLSSGRSTVSRIALIAGLTLFAGACGSDAERHAGLEIGSVVIGEPVTPERAALYLTVEDHSGAGDRLEAVEVEGVSLVSLHHTTEADGMLQMMHADGGLDVPPGEQLRLAPAGDHAMLEGIEAPVLAGQTRAVRLHFARAGVVEAVAHVVPLAEVFDALGHSGSHGDDAEHDHS